MRIISQQQQPTFLTEKNCQLSSYWHKTPSFNHSSLWSELCRFHDQNNSQRLSCTTFCVSESHFLSTWRQICWDMQQQGILWDELPTVVGWRQFAILLSVQKRWKEKSYIFSQQATVFKGDCFSFAYVLPTKLVWSDRMGSTKDLFYRHIMIKVKIWRQLIPKLQLQRTYQLFNSETLGKSHWITYKLVSLASYSICNLGNTCSQKSIIYWQG